MDGTLQSDGKDQSRCSPGRKGTDLVPRVAVYISPRRVFDFRVTFRRVTERETTTRPPCGPETITYVLLIGLIVVASIPPLVWGSRHGKETFQMTTRLKRWMYHPKHDWHNLKAIVPEETNLW